MNDSFEKGFLDGKEFGFGQGFVAGFWAAVLLISGVVVAGLLVMRVA